MLTFLTSSSVLDHRATFSQKSTGFLECKIDSLDQTLTDILKIVMRATEPKKLSSYLTLIWVCQYLFILWKSYDESCLIQLGTQVKFRWSRDHDNRTAENAFSAPWYYSEMELEPVGG